MKLMSTHSLGQSLIQSFKMVSCFCLHISLLVFGESGRCSGNPIRFLNLSVPRGKWRGAKHTSLSCDKGMSDPFAPFPKALAVGTADVDHILCVRLQLTEEKLTVHLDGDIVLLEKRKERNREKNVEIEVLVHLIHCKSWSRDENKEKETPRPSPSAKVYGELMASLHRWPTPLTPHRKEFKVILVCLFSP